MTEVEAYGLQPGDEVVMRRPGRCPRYGTVIAVRSYGFSWKMAMEICRLPELDARAIQFDGPTLEIEMDGKKTIWSAPHVSRAPVELHCECKRCAKVLVAMVPWSSYREMAHGAEIADVPLEPDIRQLLQSPLCSKCSKK